MSLPGPVLSFRRFVLCGRHVRGGVAHRPVFGGVEGGVRGRAQPNAAAVASTLTSALGVSVDQQAQAHQYAGGDDRSEHGARDGARRNQCGGQRPIRLR